MLSYRKIGTSTMQSRALGGVAGGTYLFALPGSTGACKDAWDDILLFQLDARHRPCNLVELMPRLREHMKADRKSTRLNSSHANISYAVFCLKKKKSKP